MSLRLRLPWSGPSAAQAEDERWLEALVTETHPIDEERIARVRGRVRYRAQLAAAERGALEQQPRRPFIAGRLGSGRRAAFLAVGLVLATVGGVAAAESGPGQPLYGARLAIETFTLPAEGTQDRVQAELRFLRRRLDEAAAASERGDEGAAGAALTVYQRTLATLFPTGSTTTGDVDLTGVDLPGVDLPTVVDRLSEDGELLRSINARLGRDETTATGAIDDVGRIRSAIADEVARDEAAKQNAGSGDGLGPRASNPSDKASDGKSKASPSPSNKAKHKKKKPHRASPSPSIPAAP